MVVLLSLGEQVLSWEGLGASALGGCAVVKVLMELHSPSAGKAEPTLPASSAFCITGLLQPPARVVTGLLVGSAGKCPSLLQAHPFVPLDNRLLEKAELLARFSEKLQPEPNDVTPLCPPGSLVSVCVWWSQWASCTQALPPPPLLGLIFPGTPQALGCCPGEGRQGSEPFPRPAA